MKNMFAAGNMIKKSVLQNTELLRIQTFKLSQIISNVRSAELARISFPKHEQKSGKTEIIKALSIRG